MSDHSDPLSANQAGGAIPTELARSLDASAEDLRHGRTEDVDVILARMDAKLKAHLADKSQGI